jgi:phage gp36-like protein
MPYASQQALTERYSEAALIDRTDVAEPYTGAVVAAVLERAQAGADGEIDAALRDRYRLPLDPVPRLVTDIAAALTWWWLWPASIPEDVEARAKWARDQLRRLSRGELTLDAPAVDAATSGGGVLFQSGARVFTRDTLGGF